VDYILQNTYGNTDLDEDPVIMPLYRHLMALSNIDRPMGMFDYYELSPSSSVNALKPLPEAFSTENIKKCPMCRGPLPDINQYNRIVRQGLIEEATKKFIPGPINSISHSSNACTRNRSGSNRAPTREKSSLNSHLARKSKSRRVHQQ